MTKLAGSPSGQLLVQAGGQATLGYYALPVLHHDRLVGNVDATADSKTSRLVVRAVHQDVAVTPAMTRVVHAELGARRHGSA